MAERAPNPLHHFASHDAQALADLTWGGQLAACQRQVKHPTRSGPSEGLPDLDPNQTGSSVYGARTDLD